MHNINYKQVIAHVDLQAIQHNCGVIKSKAPKSKLLAVVKSNAYGHGIAPIANALLSEVDAYGVACLNEAIEIRKISIDKPIVLLKGVLTKEELTLASELNLSIVVHNFHQLELLETTPLKNKLSVWLKIDTGMHRLGFQPDALPQAYQKLVNNPKVARPIVLMSHFSDANDLGNPKTETQLELFNKLIVDFEGERCIANSSAILGWQKTHTDWVRSGILLYGVSPFQDTTGTELGLKPAMTLTSTLFAIQPLKKGDQVGYGSAWTCPEDMPIGMANIGYGDGYPRSAQDGTPVLVNGALCQFVGRTSMDISAAIDLRLYPNANIGDEVILWGNGLPVEKIAKSANTIPYELFCRLTQRVHFKYYE